MVNNIHKIDQLKEIRKALEGMVEEIREETHSTQETKQLKELGLEFNQTAEKLANLWQQMTLLSEKLPPNAAFEAAIGGVQQLPLALWEKHLANLRLKPGE